jgi:hypothetical protein
MKIEQRTKINGVWSAAIRRGALLHPQLTLIFGSTVALREPETWTELARLYPGARLVGCSTAGEISGVQVLDDALVATALELEHGHVAISAVQVGEAPDGLELGARLANGLPREGLVHVLVISEGLRVNGSALVAGLVSALPSGVAVTGGLSGDGPRFEHTAVCLDGPAPSQQIVAIGLYGERLHIGFGSRGGWDPFGPERRITRATGNVLYELDGEPALDVYKRYLADHAGGLPATGLLFPLTIWSATSEPIVRTILAVDATERSLTFAGDVPTGHHARLMRSNVERLVEGASHAARTSLEGAAQHGPELAILISCVGRKLVLKQRTEEEVEAVREALGEAAVMTGFYSYGEISPFSRSAACELHNQTMTVTTISER